MSLILYVMSVMFYLVAKLIKKNEKGIFYHEDKKFTSEFRRNIDGGCHAEDFFILPQITDEHGFAMRMSMFWHTDGHR